MKCKKCKTPGLETDICDDCFEEQTFKEIRRQLQKKQQNKQAEEK